MKTHQKQGGFIKANNRRKIQKLVDDLADERRKNTELRLQIRILKKSGKNVK